MIATTIQTETRSGELFEAGEEEAAAAIYAPHQRPETVRLQELARDSNKDSNAHVHRKRSVKFLCWAPVTKHCPHSLLPLNTEVGLGVHVSRICPLPSGSNDVSKTLGLCDVCNALKLVSDATLTDLKSDTSDI